MDSCAAWTAGNFSARVNDYFVSTKTERKVAAFSREKFCSRPYFIARNHLIMAISLRVQNKPFGPMKRYGRPLTTVKTVEGPCPSSVPSSFPPSLR
jgi:hypothetical protein